MKFTDDEIKVLRFMAVGYRRRRISFYAHEIYNHALRNGNGRKTNETDAAGLALIASINKKAPGLICMTVSGASYKINRAFLLEAFLKHNQSDTNLTSNEYIERLEFMGMI